MLPIHEDQLSILPSSFGYIAKWSDDENSEFVRRTGTLCALNGPMPSFPLDSIREWSADEVSEPATTLDVLCAVTDPDVVVSCWLEELQKDHEWSVTGNEQSTVKPHFPSEGFSEDPWLPLLEASPYFQGVGGHL